MVVFEDSDNSSEISNATRQFLLVTRQLTAGQHQLLTSKMLSRQLSAIPDSAVSLDDHYQSKELIHEIASGVNFILKRSRKRTSSAAQRRQINTLDMNKIYSNATKPTINYNEITEALSS
jgi:hypothetical protein